MLVFGAQSVAYLALIRHLPTPFVQFLRHRAALPIASALFIGPVAINAIVYLSSGDMGNIANEAFSRPRYAGFSTAQTAIFIVGFFSLAASISAMRRSPAGSAGRRRARAFAGAFAVRDLLFVVALTLTFVLSARAPERLPEIDPLWPLATLLYVPLLAYGILQTHLFDIDLKIKTGISRSTAASIALAVVFVISKLVEAYASRNLGFVAGAIAAGLLLFAAPRLNKLGDKVANTALPKVQATTDYIAFKKLEVYKAAVEAAHETGGITEKDRASLDRLRAKLGLDESDARALEREIVGGA